MNFAMATANRADLLPFSLPSQRHFPIFFKPKLAIAEFFWKIQRKTWYSILGSDAMSLSLKNLLLKGFGLQKMGCYNGARMEITNLRVAKSRWCPNQYHCGVGVKRHLATIWLCTNTSQRLLLGSAADPSCIC